MKKKFEESITNYELDQDGFVVGVKGKLKAKDLQKEDDDGENEFDEDFFEELGIKKI